MQKLNMKEREKKWVGKLLKKREEAKGDINVTSH